MKFSIKLHNKKVRIVHCIIEGSQAITSQNIVHCISFSEGQFVLANSVDPYEMPYYEYETCFMFI